jgi:hypothetical protein
MEQEEIRERNIAIAEFMGARWRAKEDNKAPLYRFDEPIGNQYAFHHTELQYHSSWDWLLPVCKKIESEGCIVQITLCLAGHCRITKGNFKVPIKTIANVESNDPIEAVFLAVSDYCLEAKDKIKEDQQ